MPFKLSKPIKAFLYFLGTAVLTYILHFPFRLLEDAIQEFITDYITRTFAVPLTTFIVYGGAFAIAILIIWGAYSIGVIVERQKEGIGKLIKTSRESKVSGDNLQELDRLTTLLSELDKRVIELKNKAVGHNWVRKTPKDFRETVKIMANGMNMVKYKDWDKYEKEIKKKTIGRRKYVRGRDDMVDIWEALMPLLTREFKEEDFDIISNSLDGTDLGIKKFKENDNKYLHTYKKIFEIESVNSNKKLNGLVYEYIKRSYNMGNFINIIESLLKWLGYDLLPPEFISDGAINPYIKVDKYKDDMLIKIKQRINEIKNKELVDTTPTIEVKPINEHGIHYLEVKNNGEPSTFSAQIEISTDDPPIRYHLSQRYVGF